MTYTAPEVVIMIGAVATLLVNAITAWRTGAKVDTIAMKTAVIEGHVNSEKATFVEQAAARDREIHLLRNQLNASEMRAGMLAQAKATSDASHIRSTDTVTIEPAKEPS